MGELYVEGLANHDGPESCIVAREGGFEALTGVRAGQVLSRVFAASGVPTSSTRSEGNTASGIITSCWWTPRGQRP